jgi:hypothetical protein
MRSEPAADLDRECAVFTRYLLGHDPAPRVRAAYRRAHDRAVELGVEDVRAPRGRERALLELARRGPWRARAADSFARVFAPRGALRRKLVCLLAILESGAPTDAELDTADAGSAPAFVARFVLAGLGFAARVVLVALWLPFLSRARSVAP